MAPVACRTARLSDGETDGCVKMSSREWQGLVARFRSLGGTLENLTARTMDGRRGLFAEDPRQPVALRVPRSLLVPADDVRLADGRLVVASGSAVSPETRAFFEDYHAITSWSDGGRSSTRAFFSGLLDLPPASIAMLKGELGLSAWFEPLTEEVLLQHFLRARRIATSGGTFVAPMLELMNHDPRGPRLVSDPAGLALSGVFPGEVAWRYRTADSFQIFRSYQFPSPERLTFSLPFEVFDKRLGLTIRIAIDTATRDEKRSDIPWPVVSRKDGLLDVSFLLLGDRADPRNGRRAFHELLGATLTSNAEEFFEGLLFYNRQKFLQLLETVEASTAPAAQVIRTVCRLQLEGLSMVSYR